ncbi:hypothetical protein ATE84_3585 [Aquimarina sp. MAR_2010_214]|nr:hypothetical protein ATE84_3585 [Aquimarina sp. MAR_2010_214]
MFTRITLIINTYKKKRLPFQVVPSKEIKVLNNFILINISTAMQ